MAISAARWAALAAGMALAGCGGGGGSDAPAAPPPAPAATTVSGAVVKGPVSSATVTIKNAATGAVLATGATDANGVYSISVPVTSGDLIVEVTGGSYLDEATGTQKALAGALRSVVTATGGNVNGVVTPLTSLAYSYAFGSAASGVSAAAFNTRASSLATQFQLNGVNLAATTPVVSGGVNAYGQVLRGLSQYLLSQNMTLPTFTSTTFTAAQWQAFGPTFTSAYRAANPGSTISFNFDGSGVSIGGTGAGGGSGTCGVNVTGTVAAGPVTVPLNINYCVSGIAGGSCGAGNASLSQLLSGQGGVAGAANLNYTYSATCAPGAFAITLQ